MALLLSASAQEKAAVDIHSKAPSGQIDPMLYGQLFEHIYFSANNGVWQELIYERSFEPEHYPGITPRDGYFDGWYMDDDKVLHSPTRYEQPMPLTSLDTDDYEISMDVNWRSYRLARRSWSGGLMDIRFAVKNQANGEPYYVRLHNPYYEARIFTPAQTEAQIQAAELARARQQASAQATEPYFAIAKMVERDGPSFGGRVRTIKTLDPIISRNATADQINENQDWHKLRIVCKGKSISVYFDGKRVLSTSKLDATGHNDIVFWVNYTEATYKNIKVTSLNGKTTYFEGTPDVVRIPEVAPQWNAFGDASFEMVKGDAVNMDYSQKITARSKAGVSQGPQNLISGETFVGSVYAKGNGTLSVGLKRGNTFLVEQKLGVPGSGWKKFDISLPVGNNSGDADFAIIVENGTVQVDQVTLSTATGQALGGFRPDILQAVKDLHPTCLRWPGGGYVAQYYWQWGIGPQEDRYRWPHWMWMDYDQNCFGTDEFIKFCRTVNTEPVIVVSVHFERPAEEYDEILQDAVNWVRYCNAPATDEWGAKRAANGHPEPYNVKYWEIDNEMWEMGIERYEKCVREFSVAMREVDPSIRIIACGGFQEDNDFIMRSGNYFDYLSLHHYEQQGGYATGPKRLGEQYDRYAQVIAESPNPNIKLFISEWNLQSIDWKTGLFAGGFLNVCEARDVVAMGAAALFIRRTDMPDWNNAFINFDYKDVFVAPNYQVTKLWYDHFSRYRLDHEGDTKDLNVVTTLSENGRDVIVKVVNPTDKAYTLDVTGDWKGIASTAYEYYAPGALDVANSMEKKDAVALKKASPACDGSKVTLSIEPYSAGVMTIEKKF
ncbi:MAG: alpha-L-arabinofuranosidase [Bacteroidales bacterium]|nr:alpha-L-arabinofuranosidase [Bacteroidales bacterium]